MNSADTIAACASPTPDLCRVDAAGSPTCVNLQTDSNNCGACGTSVRNPFIPSTESSTSANISQCGFGTCIAGSCQGCPRSGSCSDNVACGANGDCHCRQTQASGSACAPTTSYAATCNADTDCGVGEACALYTCCGSGVCLPINQGSCANVVATKFVFRARRSARDCTTSDHIGTEDC